MIENRIAAAKTLNEFDQKIINKLNEISDIFSSIYRKVYNEYIWVNPQSKRYSYLEESDWGWILKKGRLEIISIDANYITFRKITESYSKINSLQWVNGRQVKTRFTTGDYRTYKLDTRYLSYSNWDFCKLFRTLFWDQKNSERREEIEKAEKLLKEKPKEIAELEKKIEEEKKLLAESKKKYAESQKNKEIHTSKKFEKRQAKIQARKLQKEEK